MKIKNNTSKVITILTGDAIKPFQTKEIFVGRTEKEQLKLLEKKGIISIED